MTIEEHVLFVDEEGNVECLAVDDLDLTRVGHVHGQRAGHVEWSEALQAWDVREASGRPIGSATLRGAAIAMERARVNALLELGDHSFLPPVFDRT